MASATMIPTTFDQSTQPQESFASNYDLDNPLGAMSSYSKLIHQHTKRQMELATMSHNRRSSSKADGVTSASSLNSEASTESADSLQQ